MSKQDKLVTAAAATKALDSLDDCARMDVGIDAVGPRGTLERFIKQHTAPPVVEQDKLVAWHNPRADKLRAALRDIADTKNLTATPQQFARALQRMACDALTSDALDEPAPPAPELPALPVAEAFSLTRSIYTADDMRGYARTAVAADRAAREPLTLTEFPPLPECSGLAGFTDNQMREYARAVLAATQGAQQ